MDIISATFLVLAIVPAASYGWGMRGTTIGGEKGAMLPGALIGGLLAIFSDILIVQEHFYIFSALGAIAMYFGGCMTYGETLAFSMSARPAENMKKGLIALLVKGALWFGCFGAIFATGVCAVCGKFNLVELLLIFLITPILSVLFYKLFNKPLDIEENKYPKIYFSKTRQESWGAMLGIFVSLYAFGIINLDLFSIVFPLCCALFGGAGWVLGQLLQVYSKHYAESSKGIFGRLFAESRGVDPWKEMECVLGAFGGLGAAIGFILSYDSFKDTVFCLELNSGLKPLNNTLSIILFVIWLILLLVDMVHYFIKKPYTQEELNSLLSVGKISKKIYQSKLSQAVDVIPKWYNIYKKTLEPIEFVLYATLPFIMICLGSIQTAQTMSFFIIYWVIVQEVAFEKAYSTAKSLVLKIALSVIGFVILVLQLGFKITFDYKITFILYTVIYELLTLTWILPGFIEKIKNRFELFKKEDGSEKPRIKELIRRNGTIIVHGYFIFCIIFVLIIIL